MTLGFTTNFFRHSVIIYFAMMIPEAILSPLQFTEALFNCYSNKDLSAFLMAISQNTLFDLLRNSFLIPYRFNADGKQNPIIMTDDNGILLPEFRILFMKKTISIFITFAKSS